MFIAFVFPLILPSLGVFLNFGCDWMIVLYSRLCVRVICFAEQKPAEKLSQAKVFESFPV